MVQSFKAFKTVPASHRCWCQDPYTDKIQPSSYRERWSKDCKVKTYKYGKHVSLALYTEFSRHILVNIGVVWQGSSSGLLWLERVHQAVHDPGPPCTPGYHHTTQQGPHLSRGRYPGTAGRSACTAPRTCATGCKPWACRTAVAGPEQRDISIFSLFYYGFCAYKWMWDDLNFLKVICMFEFGNSALLPTNETEIWWILKLILLFFVLYQEMRIR